MIFTKIRAYLYLGIGLLVSGLLFVVKVLTARNSLLSRRVETTEARIKHTTAVMRSDKAADEQADIGLAEVKNEIKNTGGSSTFRDPNELFLSLIHI